jgi:hypothetical protein
MPVFLATARLQLEDACLRLIQTPKRCLSYNKLSLIKHLSIPGNNSTIAAIQTFSSLPLHEIMPNLKVLSLRPRLEYLCFGRGDPQFPFYYNLENEEQLANDPHGVVVAGKIVRYYVRVGADFFRYQDARALKELVARKRTYRILLNTCIRSQSTTGERNVSIVSFCLHFALLW